MLTALLAFAPAFAAEPAWVKVDPHTAADAVATLAACRAEAVLVGTRGRTHDWRLVDACMQAHGFVPADDPVGQWLPASAGCVTGASTVTAAGDALERCMHEATFVDASGWPHVNPVLAQACMATEGWVAATPAQWTARTTACTDSAMATR